MLRMDNPFAQYGITASQLTLELPHPEGKLTELLGAKKESVAKKILSMQKQDNAREDIKTAKLEGQAKRETAEQERMIVADGEIIERQKEVKLARLQAEKEEVERNKVAALAIIDKTKDLQMAKADEGIQLANSKAAIYQAKAIQAKGLAEAAVKKADYQAIDRVIFAEEVRRDIELAKYQALPNLKIQMPNNVMITGGSEKGSTTIEDLANMSIVDKMGNFGK